MNPALDPATGSETAGDETEQSELDLGVVPTGSAEVDAALSPLDSLSERPVGEHAAVFEQVFEGLSRTMSADSSESSEGTTAVEAAAAGGESPAQHD